MKYNIDLVEFNVIREEIKKYAMSQKTKELLDSIAPIDKYLLEDSLLDIDNLVKLKYQYAYIPLDENYEISYCFAYLKLGLDLNCDDLVLFRESFITNESIFNYINELKKANIINPIREKYLSKLLSTSKLLKEFNLVFDFDSTILDTASPMLKSIRESLKRNQLSMKEKAYDLLNKYKEYLSDSIVVSRNDSFCLPVLSTHKNKIDGIVLDISSSGTTVFIEPKSITTIRERINELKLEEQKEINKILHLLSIKLINNLELLESNYNLLNLLDYKLSITKYCYTNNCVKVNINHEGILDLKDGYSPLIKRDKCVPISISFDKNNKLVLITGPNTGGKTVALKTVGLLCYMSLCGILIPANEKSNIPYFDSILIDIGDAQSIVNSLSTFSSHMTRLIEMTEHDTNNTLYLIDEICTGTDPLEGVSLSKAILLHLVKNDNRIICTTHYSELVNFVKSYNLGSLARVDFDIESLSPLYSITFGISGKSQGINISKRLGLSKELTNSALKFLKKESSEEEKLANFLTFEKDRLMKLNNSLELKLEEQKKEDERLEKLSETIRLNEIKIKQDLEKENEKKISSVLNELEVVLEKVKNNNKESYSNLKGEVNKLTKKIELNDKIITEEIKVGDTVLINYINQYGKVINIRNNKYEVEYDSFTTTFKLSDITLVNNPVIKEVNYKPKKFKNIEQTEYTPKFIGKSITTCDLRGVRYNEVNEILSSHLYELIELGMHSLRIIHGYGSGAVKQAVYEFINNEMSIKRSELGGKQESQGVTIIYF